MTFENKTFLSLLKMPEGPALDFKREQYPFTGESKGVQSELLKDILAFANSSRDSPAYILIGVDEVNGVFAKVTGIHNHLEDANLHQFVNRKTNKAVDFSYFPFAVEDKEIGVLVIPVQSRPFFVWRDFGKIKANTVYVRDGSSTKIASPDEIIAMEKARPPQWIIEEMRIRAKNAVISVVRQWNENPYRARELRSPHRNLTYEVAYEVAREFVLGRSLIIDDYQSGIDSYGSLHCVFRWFTQLASHCDKSLRVANSTISAYEALSQAMLDLEECVRKEEQTWEGFLSRTQNHNSPLPSEASYNLLAIAEVTVRLVDVLDSENFTGDPEYLYRRKFVQVHLWRSKEWNECR